MPPRKISAAMRQRAPMLATSAELQEVALAEWQSKLNRDSKTLESLSSKISSHKRAIQLSRRQEIWTREQESLDQELVVSQLEFEKALLSCSASLSESLVREWRYQDERVGELTSSLGFRVANVRKAVLELHQQRTPGESTTEAAETVQKRLAVLLEEVAESKMIVDAEADDLANSTVEEELEEDKWIDTLRCLAQSTTKAFLLLSTSRCSTFSETHQCALEGEEAKALTDLLALKGSKTVHLSPKDQRSVALIVKTYDGISNLCKNADPVSMASLYDRVQSSLGSGVSRCAVRHAVDELLRQRRAKIAARSVILQYKKRVSELLASYENTLKTEDESAKELCAIEEEERTRQELRQKRGETLDRIRAIRDAERAAQLEEAKLKQTEEEERNQQFLRAREAEFQDRLRRLREYQIKQRMIEDKERAVRLAMEEENAIQKALLRERNAKRVVERQKEYEEKCRRRAQEQEEVEKLKEARAKVLDIFFKDVEKRLGVTRDAERVLRGTASKQAEPFVSCSETTQFAVHGYTVDDVMKDPRFRLQLALVDAGLHQTPYGREVICRGFRVSAAQRPSDDNPLRMEY